MFVCLSLSPSPFVRVYRPTQSSTCAAGFNNTRFPAHSGHHVEGYLKPGMHSQMAPTVIRRTCMMQTAQAHVQTLPIVLSRACPLPFAFAYSTSAKLPAFGDHRTDSNPMPNTEQTNTTTAKVPAFGGHLAAADTYRKLPGGYTRPSFDKGVEYDGQVQGVC